MDLRRLRAGEWLTALLGLVLAVSLVLPWYGVSGVAEADVTAFQAFAVTDIYLALVALAAIAVVPVTAVPRSPTLALAYESLLWLFTAVAAVVALFRLLDAPGDGLSRQVGAYLGVIAALGLLATLLVAMRDERLSRPGHPTDSSGVPVASVPEIETLPAPRP